MHNHCRSRKYRTSGERLRWPYLQLISPFPIQPVGILRMACVFQSPWSLLASLLSLPSSSHPQTQTQTQCVSFLKVRRGIGSNTYSQHSLPQLSRENSSRGCGEFENWTTAHLSLCSKASDCVGHILSVG